jgi:PPK2 family polyphosphate:nucleotide phosphotransferase
MPKNSQKRIKPSADPSYSIAPHSKFKLRKCDPSDTGEFGDSEEGRQKAKEKTQKILTELSELQELLYADRKRALLIVLQGTDTSGKDGTIKQVMSSFNPQGCRVTSFKIPTEEELSRDFLWRIHREVPPKGFVGIFNRSHYEDVLAPRVHDRLSGEAVKKRFRQINDFEHLLSETGTVVLKFFLHISKEEQRRRLEKRVRDPKKHWKFNVNDLRERRLWDDYQDAFQEMIRETTTPQAPWIVVPADHKWYRNLLVGRALIAALKQMNLKYPAGPKGLDFGKVKIR